VSSVPMATIRSKLPGSRSSESSTACDPPAARANEHYAGKLRDAAAGLTRFLREVGLIGGPSELLWKRAGLV